MDFSIDLPQQEFKLGLQQLQNKNFAVAITHFTSAIELKSDFTEAFEKRGFCYYRTNNFQLAVDDFSHVYDGTETNLKLIIPFADSQRYLRNFECSINILYVGMRLMPLEASLYFHRGLSFFDNNQIEFAISDFLAAYHLNNSLDKSLYYIGACLMKFDSKNDAIKYFDDFIAKSTDNYFLSSCYYKQAILFNQLDDFNMFQIKMLKAASLGLEEAKKLVEEMQLK